MSCNFFLCSLTLYRSVKCTEKVQSKFSLSENPCSLYPDHESECYQNWRSLCVPSRHRACPRRSESEVARSCPTLCDPMDCSPPGSSVHGILQARVLEWGAIAFSRGSSWPRDRIWVSRIVGRCFTIWATREVPRGNRYSACHLLWWALPVRELCMMSVELHSTPSFVFGFPPSLLLRGDDPDDCVSLRSAHFDCCVLFWCLNKPSCIYSNAIY